MKISLNKKKLTDIAFHCTEFSRGRTFGADPLYRCIVALYEILPGTSLFSNSHHDFSERAFRLALRIPSFWR